MAEIITAKSAGFCFGVQRAVETVYEEVKKGGPIYTYGPIIHNEEVVADLEKKGVHVIASDEELADIHGGTIITRSHGISREEDEKLRATGAKCVDPTCPFVKRIHRIVEENSAEGYEIVIIGNPVHPEVRGIMGWSSVPVTVIEIRSRRELLLKGRLPNKQLPAIREISVSFRRPPYTQTNLKKSLLF